MVLVKFLGGAREVGRSAVLIESESGKSCLLDYGVRFKNENRLPVEADLGDLQAIALSHCHVDHSGALPYIYTKYEVPLLTNALTHQVSEILLRDLIKISRHSYPFGYKELDLLRRNTLFLENKVRHKIDDNFFITFYNAGHIPGSVSILVEVDDKRIFYTGDINTQETNLINGANPDEIPKIDCLITESTYALKDHPNRERLEKKFIENVVNVIEDNGKVLIPAFGVARSQEAFLMLKKYGFQGKIYLDGLSKKVSALYFDHPNSLKDFQSYKKAFSDSKFVTFKNRKQIRNNSSYVMITPSGMIKGGAVLYYIKDMLEDPRSAIYMVGYQADDAPGNKLLEKGVFEYHDNRRSKKRVQDMQIEAKCNVDYFDFSSHADSSQLLAYVNKLHFRKNHNAIFCIHGDEKATTTFAKKLAQLDFNAVAPEAGETYKL
ncbi:MAG: MBL fold metallo-hydrolase [Promethearchaeota archaeon]|nr:MAG: MBL fold metallo-hydrolase [Candidatus Lokiarchaeota archaeon]